MLSTDQITRCDNILAHYGIFTERDKAIEELSEASVEIMKLVGGIARVTQYPDEIEKEALAEEMADVLITLRHITSAYKLGPLLDELIEFKLGRQEQRMEADRLRDRLMLGQDAHLVTGEEE